MSACTCERCPVHAPKPEAICNLCGLTCNLGDAGPHGLIDAAVSGGYESTPGNGRGALDDMSTYRFNLCEFCLDWLFRAFRVSPIVQTYDGEVEPFVPAEDRVRLHEWRRMKDEFFTEQFRREARRRCATVYQSAGEPKR